MRELQNMHSDMLDFMVLPNIEDSFFLISFCISATLSFKPINIVIVLQSLNYLECDAGYPLIAMNYDSDLYFSLSFR
jgi:hypothetical protein